MHKPCLRLLLLVIVLLSARPLWALVPEDVVVVYNTTASLDGASEGVARYYAQAEGIPAANLLGIQTSADYKMHYYDFVPQIGAPVSSFVAARPNVKVIVLCYGIPYCTQGTRMGIDSLLTLLGNPGVLSSDYLDAYLPNPYYGLDVDFGTFRDSPENTLYAGNNTYWRLNYLVCRIDAFSSPTDTVSVGGGQFRIPRDIRLMIDRSVSANAKGRAGLTQARAVLDDCDDTDVIRTFAQAAEDAVNAALYPITGSQDNVRRDPGMAANPPVPNAYLVDEQNVLAYCSNGIWDTKGNQVTIWWRPRNTWLDGSIGFYWNESRDAYWLNTPYMVGPTTTGRDTTPGIDEANILKARGLPATAPYNAGFEVRLLATQTRQVLGSALFQSGVARISGLDSISWPDDHCTSLELLFPADDPYHPGEVILSSDLGTAIYDSRDTGYTFKYAVEQASSSELIRDGCTATVGNVGEPWPSPNHDPSLIFARYLRGYSFAEAAWMGTPFVAWRHIAIGDPLMAPCAWRPSVEFVSPTPADGSLVTGEVSLAVDPTPTGNGSISRVEFWVEGNGARRKIGSTTSAPYECTWNTSEVVGDVSIYPDGAYKIRTVACQSGEAVGESNAERSFRVANHLGKVAALAPMSDGDPVLLRDVPIAAGTGSSMEGAFYAEDLDRAAGIRVVTSQTVPSQGAVQVLGILRKQGVVERYIEASQVTTNEEGSAVIPLGMPGAVLGGAAPVGTPGVESAVGLYNTGLLVRVHGKVSYVGDDFIYLDDGSSLSDGNVFGALGVKVFFGVPPGLSIGDCIGVTGVSSIAEIAGHRCRLLRAVGAADVYLDGVGLLSIPSACAAAAPYLADPLSTLF